MIAEAIAGLMMGAARSIDLGHPQDPAQARIFGGGSTRAGVLVDEDRVLGYPAYFRAVSIIAAGIARLPIEVRRRIGETDEVDRIHSSYYTLRHKPNRDMTEYSFGEVMQHWCMSWGNGIAAITRGGDGRIVDPRQDPTGGMIPLLPGTVALVRERGGGFTGNLNASGELVYAIKMPDGSPRKLPADDVFHVKGLTDNGYWGIPVVEKLKETFGAVIGGRDAAARYYGQGMMNSGYIETPDGMGLKDLCGDDEEAQEKFLDSLHKASAGLGKAHRNVLLEWGLKYKPAAMAADNAQFLQTRNFDRSEISLVTGVQPHMLGDNTRLAYNSLEMSRHEHKEEGLGPWIARWEDELREKCLSEREKDSESHFVKLNTDNLEFVPYKDRVEGASKELNNGLASQDEARRRIGRPPSGDENASRYRKPQNIGWSDEQKSQVITPRPDVEPADDQTAEASDHAQAVRTLTEWELNRIVSRLSNQAKQHAKTSKAYVAWLDDAFTDDRKHGPDVLSDRWLPMVANMRQRFTALIDPPHTAEDLKANVESLATELETLPAKYLENGNG